MEDEIEFLKRKKMIEYMRRYYEKLVETSRKKEGAEEDIYVKIKSLMTKDGYNYLLNLRRLKPRLADNVLKNIILLLLNGLLEYPVDKETVIVLEKKLEGYKGKIYVEKKGELKEFRESLKEDI
jgi:DNA-binding TFAR19-related protein (PDSD5 family)